MIDVQIGADWGSSLIRRPTRMDERVNRSPAAAIIAEGRAVTVHPAKGAAKVATITLASGAEAPGGVLMTGRLGELPEATVTLLDQSAAPAELWLHEVDSHWSTGWHRYRCGTGSGAAAVVQPAPQTVGWWWDSLNIASSSTGDPWPVFGPSSIDGPLILQALGGVPVGDTVARLRAHDGETGTARDLGSVTLPAGQTAVTGVPITADLAAGSLWVVLDEAPPLGVASSTAASLESGAPMVTSGSTVGAVYTATAMVTGVTATSTLPGDMVVVLYVGQSPAPRMGAAWTRHVLAAAAPAGTAAPRVQVAIFSAPWSAGLDMGITLTPYTPPGGATITTSPMVLQTFLMRGLDPAAPVRVVQVRTPAAGSGAALTYAAVTTAAATDLVLTVTGWHAPAGTTGQTATIAPAPSVGTDGAMTTRSAAANIGMCLGIFGTVAAGGTFPSTAVTVAGGSGPTTGLTLAGVVLMFKRAQTVTAPTKIAAWVQVH